MIKTTNMSYFANDDAINDDAFQFNCRMGYRLYLLSFKIFKNG